MDEIEFLQLLTVLPVFGITIFILARKFWLWYWKVDVRVRLLESIDTKMSVIINQGLDLDPKEIPKTIDNDEEQEPFWHPSVWILIIIPIIIGILVYILGR